MSNDVPGGAESLLVPPAGVVKAGGVRARVLIELRAQICALEQVPVFWPIPPHRAGPPRCFFLLSLLRSLPPPASPLTGGDGHFPLHKLKCGGLHELRAEAYRDGPASLGFALAMIAEQADARRQRDLVLWCLTKTAARNGDALMDRLPRLRPRPCAFSYRRGEDGGRRRLGPGRRTEEAGR